MISVEPADCRGIAEIIGSGPSRRVVLKQACGVPEPGASHLPGDLGRDVVFVERGFPLRCRKMGT
ncbi:MAG: hypothetical protein ACXVLX_20400, partial [Ilumatobacteraceae bacterium]